jgi:hypothetical protein
MQRSSASAGGNRWLRWVRVCFFGVLLGLLQLGLLLQGQKLEEWATTLWPVIAIGVLLYVLIPALEGFLAGWQTEDALAGTGSGCQVAGVGFLVLVVSFILGALLTPPSCQPGPHVICGPGLAGVALLGAAIELIGILFVVEFIGSAVGGLLGSVVGGLVGGWIGGLLRERRARQAHQGSVRAAQEPSPGEVP